MVLERDRHLKLYKPDCAPRVIAGLWLAFTYGALSFGCSVTSNGSHDTPPSPNTLSERAVEVDGSKVSETSPDPETTRVAQEPPEAGEAPAAPTRETVLEAEPPTPSPTWLEETLGGPGKRTLSEAVSFYEAERFEKACDSLSLVESRYSLSAAFQVAYGQALLRAGRYDEAISRFEKGAALRQDGGPALHLLGQLYIASSNYEKAAACYARLLAASPRDDVAKLGRAFALSELGRRVEARDELLAAKAAAPGLFPSWGQELLAEYSTTLPPPAHSAERAYAVKLPHAQPSLAPTLRPVTEPQPVLRNNWPTRLTAENGSYYGEISPATGRPKTVHVGGYFRKDGTYVRGHYRSKPRW